MPTDREAYGIPEPSSEPVVALPPCPTCEGRGRVPTPWHDYRDPTCPACNGSGVEPVVRVAVLRAWIEEQRVSVPMSQRWIVDDLADLSSFLDGLDATGGER